jgi:hypothetical protein
MVPVIDFSKLWRTRIQQYTLEDPAPIFSFSWYFPPTITTSKTCRLESPDPVPECILEAMPERNEW